MPRNTGNNGTDRLLADVKLSRKALLRVEPGNVEAADFGNLFLRQDRRRIMLTCPYADVQAGAACISFLGNGIPSVLEWRAKPKMIGPHATRGVAGMADKQAGRDRAIGKFIGKAVRFDGSPCDLEVAVALDEMSSPKPARFCLIDVRPEALFKGQHTNQTALTGRTGAALE